MPNSAMLQVDYLLKYIFKKYCLKNRDSIFFVSSTFFSNGQYLVTVKKVDSRVFNINILIIIDEKCLGMSII